MKSEFFGPSLIHQKGHEFMKEKVTHKELSNDAQMDLLLEMMKQGKESRDDDEVSEEGIGQRFKARNQKTAGRPKKADSEKSKYCGLWLNKEYQDLVKNLPFGQGLSTKLKKLVDFYYASLEREKGIQEHLEKLLKNSEGLISKDMDAENRQKLMTLINEWNYLARILRLSERSMVASLNGVNLKRYKKLMQIKELLWKDSSAAPSHLMN